MQHALTDTERSARDKQRVHVPTDSSTRKTGGDVFVFYREFIQGRRGGELHKIQNKMYLF